MNNKTQKILRKHFADRYQNAIELWQSKILSDDDAVLFSEKEPTVSYTLQQIKKQQADDKNKETTKAILERDEALIDAHIETTKKEREVLDEAFVKLMMTDPKTPDEAVAKQGELNYLSERKKSCDIVLKDLEDCKTQYFKTKRGRPANVEEKTIFELARNIKEVDDNGLSLDDRIIALLKQLSPEKKKYLVEYINQMLETENKMKEIGAQNE